MNRSNRRMSWRRWMCLGSVPALALAVVLWSQARAQDPVPNAVPVVSFTSGSYTITEGDSVTITVTLSEASTHTVSVDYCIAVNDRGLGAQSNGTIQFAPGETIKSNSFMILDDGCCQGTGTAEVSLGNPQGAALGSPSIMSITVLDNDTCP